MQGRRSTVGKIYLSAVKRYNQLQRYLRHCTELWLKWPVHDLVLVTPLHPLSKLLAIQDHAQTWRNNFEWKGGPVTSSYLKHERLFFHESVSTGCSSVPFSSMQCKHILGGQNLVCVRNIVVAAFFNFMAVEDWGE